MSPSDATELTLDPNTANGYLSLSEGNRKATCAAWQTYSDHPERFDSRQYVLCTQALTGRHYWEVEWTEGGYEIGVGLTYGTLGRKGKCEETGFGSNSSSWYLGVRKGFCVMHDDKESSIPLPAAGCKRVAVFLDCPAGSLSFYKVSSNSLSHIHTFRATFTEPLHPGFYVYNTSHYAALSPLH